ncbi:hypothetical protein J6590_065808 [Homalodisca vitripennis]|nr:hypothetical protein J6590_065808 [Homalodisca vitripennis]
MCFNEGSIDKTNVLKLLGFQPGKFMVEGLRNIASEKIKRANIEVREGNKKKRVRRRLFKKKQEENESAVTALPTKSSALRHSTFCQLMIALSLIFMRHAQSPQRSDIMLRLQRNVIGVPFQLTIQ